MTRGVKPRPVRRLTDAERELAASGLDAARRSVWRMAPAAAAVLGVGLADLRQEAYLACCLASQTYRPPGDFECYAATAARNKLRMLLRAAGQKCRRADVVRLSDMDFADADSICEDRRLDMRQ